MNWMQAFSSRIFCNRPSWAVAECHYLQADELIELHATGAGEAVREGGVSLTDDCTAVRCSEFDWF